MFPLSNFIRELPLEYGIQFLFVFYLQLVVLGIAKKANFSKTVPVVPVHDHDHDHKNWLNHDHDHKKYILQATQFCSWLWLWSSQFVCCRQPSSVRDRGHGRGGRASMTTLARRARRARRSC